MQIATMMKLCRCGSCRERFTSLRFFNFVELNRLAWWKYPTAGNLLKGTTGKAIATMCSQCIDAGNSAVFAVEFAVEEGENVVVEHFVSQLEYSNG